MRDVFMLCVCVCVLRVNSFSCAESEGKSDRRVGQAEPVRSVSPCFSYLFIYQTATSVDCVRALLVFYSFKIKID